MCRDSTKYAVSDDCLSIQVFFSLAGSSATSTFFFILSFDGVTMTLEDRLPFRSPVLGLGLLFLARCPFFTIDIFLILLFLPFSSLSTLGKRFGLLRGFAISLARRSSLTGYLGVECSSI
jgi:hypothetical protein